MSDLEMKRLYLSMDTFTKDIFYNIHIYELFINQHVTVNVILRLGHGYESPPPPPPQHVNV